MRRVIAILLALCATALTSCVNPERSTAKPGNGAYRSTS